MRIAKFGTIGILSACATLTAASAAFAQAAPAPAPAPAAPATPDPAAAPAAPAAAAPAPAAQAQVGVGLPAAAPAADPNGSDHDSVVGHLAVGYLGRPGMLMAAPAGTPGLDGLGRVNRAAPIIGIRYWIDPLIGIDAGIGLSIASESVTPPAPAAEQKNFAPTVFMIHGGVPLALTSSKHFSFQIIPELNFGTASGSFQPAPNAAGVPQGPKTTFTGTHFDIGARAGAEIHFGFIGIPQLSLQAGIGLAFATDSTKATTDAFTDAAGMVTPGFTTKTSASNLATSVGDNPWNIFTSNVAALYYF